MTSLASYLNSQKEGANQTVEEMNLHDELIRQGQGDFAISHGRRLREIHNQRQPRRTNTIRPRSISSIWCWALLKFVRVAAKSLVGVFLTLFGISILTSIVWDYRCLESNIMNMTNGILSENHLRAIGHWQLALNHLVHDLDPNLPIHKIDQRGFMGRCWENVIRAWQDYWYQ